MEREQQWRAYRTTYRSLSARIERWLIQVAILALLFLLVVQAVLVLPRGERLLSLAAFLEGEPAPAVTSWLGGAQRRGEVALPAGVGAPWAEPSITLQVEGGARVPGLKLLVDGRVVGEFGQGPVTIVARDGASLSAEGGGGKPPPVLVTSGAVGVTLPKIGYRWVLASERVSLGRVQVTR
jgi:hypothetical protein